MCPDTCVIFCMASVALKIAVYRTDAKHVAMRFVSSSILTMAMRILIVGFLHIGMISPAGGIVNEIMRGVRLLSHRQAMRAL